MAVDTRPAVLTPVHNYNLRNQGWPWSFPCARVEHGEGFPLIMDPVIRTREVLGVYPSNADIIHYARMTTARDPLNLNLYSPWELRRQVFGTTPAPKGHHILPAFNKNRQIASGISGIYDPARDVTDDRPISVAFHAGRVFYLMPNGEIYFSQVLTDIIRADKCFQEADPTAEDINELVATDGGHIDIAGIAEGLALFPTRSELVILANNGVWSVANPEGSGFSAVNHEVRRLTNVGAIGAEAAVEAEGLVFFWSPGGIYMLAPNEVTGILQEHNLSESTIQTFYLEISAAAKTNARGFYDKQTKKIHWFYNSDPSFTGEEYRYRYNSVLTYDLITQAWYPYSLPTGVFLPFISAMVEKKAIGFEPITEDVQDGALSVIDNDLQVIDTALHRVSADVKIKLLTFLRSPENTYTYTFSEFRNEHCRDWEILTTDGIPYVSFIETGHFIGEDLISEKEANTVYVFFKRTEENLQLNEDGGLEFDYPSSCNLQAKWQFSDSASSGRWSEVQEVYRLDRHWIPSGTGPFDYGMEVIQTINQVRGKGRALSLRFESVDDKDFHLLGWSIPLVYMIAA